MFKAFKVLPIFILLTGCLLQKAPKNFVISNDINKAQLQLSLLNVDESNKIRFSKGSHKFNDKEKKSLDDWLNKERPSLVVILGAGGSIKYKELGENRAMEVAKYIQLKGYDSIIREYTDQAPGGAAYLWSLQSPESDKILSSAPILVIYGS